MYLLDTDIVIAMLRGQYGIQERILDAGFDACGISEITLAELYTGAFKTGLEKDLGQVEFAASHFPVYPVGDAIKTYARIRADLEKSGIRLDSMDLLIAATALYGGFILVTGNARHFSRIPGLRIENWIAR